MAKNDINDLLQLAAEYEISVSERLYYERAHRNAKTDKVKAQIIDKLQIRLGIARTQWSHN